MASTEEVARILPETLPADFGDWDSEGSQAPAPGPAVKWEETGGQDATQKPHAQSDYLDAILESFENKPRVWRSESSAAVFVKPPAFVQPQDEFDKWQKAAAQRLNEDLGESEAAKPADEAQKPFELSAERKASIAEIMDPHSDPWPELSEPVFAKPQKSTFEQMDAGPKQTAQSAGASQTAEEAPIAPSRPNTAAVEGAAVASELPNPSIRESDSALFEIFSRKGFEVEEEQTTAKRKWVIVAAACGGSILIPLILMISMGHHGTKVQAKQPVQPPADVTDSQAAAGAPAPAVNQPATNGEPQATAQKQSATDNPSARKGSASTAPAVTEAQLEMMNDQLEAPRMIPQEAKKQVAETAPPPASLAGAGVDGLGGNSANDAEFKGHEPSVKAVRFEPLAISSGVAEGMLLHQTAPLYPSIAKAARVSGTVELHAIISKMGTITNLHVVSGPVMLQGPAVDAVRSWRYRPYTLNDEPVDVETTINVVFNLEN